MRETATIAARAVAAQKVEADAPLHITPAANGRTKATAWTAIAASRTTIVGELARFAAAALAPLKVAAGLRPAAGAAIATVSTVVEAATTTTVATVAGTATVAAGS